MLNFILTLIAAAVVGAIFFKLKVPAGVMVGSVIGSMLLSVCFNLAYMPASGKFLAQAIAGTYIATTVRKEDFEKLKTAAKPALILLLSLLTLTAVMGFAMHAVSELDLLTSLMSAVPGGIADVTMISADMGADAPKVAVLQFIRLIVGIAVFPSIIAGVCKNEPMEIAQDSSLASGGKKPAASVKLIGITLVVGIAGGFLGYLTKIPAGTLIFSLISVIAYNVFSGNAVVPIGIKRFAQVLAGAYIGSGIYAEDILQMKTLVLPAIILILGYTANCFFMGFVLSKFCGFSRREAMLAATPAGASDMALIASDLGVFSPTLLVLQIFRMMMAIILFPQFVRLLIVIFG